MKQGLAINLILALIVLGLLWVVFVKRETPSAGGYALSQLDSASVNEIIIAAAKQARIVLAKRKEMWFVSEPLQARADRTRVDGLLGLLNAHSDKRMAATDLGRFQLDQALARVRIGPQEFIFGGTQPLSNQMYVQTQGAVYLISPVYFVDVAKPASDYIAKNLLAENEIPVGYTMPRFSMTRSDGNWHITPANAALSQDSANAYADNWQHAIANSVTSLPTAASAEMLTLKFKSGAQTQIAAMREGSNITLWRSDEKLAYQFTASAAMALLAPAFAPH